MTSAEIEKIRTLLSPIFEPEREIERIEGKTFVPPGENFTSIVWALEIHINEDGQRKCVHAAAKVTPKNQINMKHQNISQKFLKEITTYEKVFPALVAFQESCSIKNRLESVAPKFYGGYVEQLENGDEQGVVVLEDLNIKGYKTLDKFKGMNLSCAKAVLRQLAKLHAVPIAYKTQKPELFNDEIKPHLTSLNASFNMNTLGPDPVALIMVAWRNFAKYVPEHESEINKFQGWCERFVQGKGPGIVEQFATVSHNDLWISNVLFKFVGEECEDVKIVDYQALGYHSFAKDLLLFLHVSLEDDVLDECHDELVLYYYNHFVCTLEEHGTDSTPFTFEAMTAEIDRVARSGVGFQCLWILWIVFLNPVDVVEVEKFDVRFFLESVPSKEHVTKFKQLMKIFLEKEYI